MPSLEHNNEVKGESLDLIRYIDSHFEGPSLFPDVRFREYLVNECWLLYVIQMLTPCRFRILGRKSLETSCCPTRTPSIDLCFRRLNKMKSSQMVRRSLASFDVI